MRGVNQLFYFLVASVLLLLTGCSDHDLSGSLPEGRVVVRLAIDGSYSRSPGDVTPSVNRIYVLPFRKMNEGLNDDSVNFVPEYGAARQLDVVSFPVVSTFLNLQSASSYRILILGYNRLDYDAAHPDVVSTRFSIGPGAASATLANLYLQPASPVVVPEFFSCPATGYLPGGAVGNVFKPGDVTYIRGNLQRLVSGLTIGIGNIPGYVTSLTLVAERLATSLGASDGVPLTWQTAGDGGLKTFSRQVPVSGRVTFDQFVLPSTDVHNTLLYLDVAFGTSTQRYVVRVPDTPGVSSGNRITFARNHWVRIDGDYSKIDLGFTISDDINLDDDAWDGLQ